MVYLIGKEIEYQSELKFKRTVNSARFPKIKYIHVFDFIFQPSINQQEILNLKSMHFLEDSINICFLDNSGLVKRI